MSDATSKKTDSTQTDSKKSDRAAEPGLTTPAMLDAESEVVRTRAQLAATVDELADRLDPRNQAKEAVDGAKRLLHDATAKDAEPHRRTRARAVLGGAVAVVALLAAASIRGRRG